MQTQHFSEIITHWDIEYKREKPEISIAGSPERTSYRMVFEGLDNRKYIIEQINEEQYQIKHRICKTLEYLKKQDFSFVQPYLKNNNDEYLTKINKDYWQLIPYIPGTELDRPSYVYDEWRGEQLAKILIQLYEKTVDISNEIIFPVFSLKDYVLDMIQRMQKHNKQEKQALEPIIEYLSTEFFPNYDTIPKIFCHGDYHCLNIIWDHHSVKTVIDWEFLGIKAEIYDMANLLGCLGIEDPRSLVKGFAHRFIKEMKTSSFISPIGFDYLLDYIMALRFGWLSEWFRKKLPDMVELEIDYLHLLYKHKEIIKKNWSSI